MSNLFHVDILSCDKVIYDTEALSLVVPAELGYMEILANHAPLIARLREGKITLKASSGEKKVFDAQGPGYMEVLKNNVTVIFDYPSNN